MRFPISVGITVIELYPRPHVRVCIWFGSKHKNLELLTNRVVRFLSEFHSTYYHEDLKYSLFIENLVSNKLHVIAML